MGKRNVNTSSLDNSSQAITQPSASTPKAVQAGDAIVSATYTCTPKISIKAKAKLKDSAEGYEFQVVLDPDSCSGLANIPFNVFICHMQFYPDDGNSYTKSVSFSNSSYAAGEPQIIIGRQWISNYFLSQAESSWKIRVHAEVKEGFTIKKHIKDMHTERLFNVRDDGTFIYKIKLPNTK